jgi:hypothetical protein
LIWARTGLSFLTILALSGPLSPPAGAADKVISGQVRDHKNRPIGSVKVDLWTRDGNFSLSEKTDKNGKFSLAHPSCNQCFLEVQAPRKLGLASALVEDIPGDEARSIIVSLRKGFPVSGRVVASGKGLKGIVVKVYSRDHEHDVKARVYGGGATVTGRGGDFEMLLTPGDKKLILLNKRYKKLAKSTSIEFKVIVDTNLEDIELPEG